MVRIGVGAWRIYTYIPLVMAPNADDVTKKAGYSQIARGVAEILLPDIGVIALLALDIAVTALRHLPQGQTR